MSELHKAPRRTAIETLERRFPHANIRRLVNLAGAVVAISAVVIFVIPAIIAAVDSWTDFLNHFQF